MAFERPSLKELRARTAGDLDTYLQGTNASLRRSSTKALSTAHAGTAHGLHGHVAYIADQVLEDKAEGEYLYRRGAIRGITPDPATYATGTIEVTGLDDTVIELGTQWQRDDGVLYESTAEATIAAGVASVPVTALAPGLDGNCGAGTAVSLVATVEGITDAGATGTIRGGSDDETEEDFRERLVARIRRPPAGGNKYDYPRWAEEITGVKKAWCVPCGQGPGTTDIVIIADEEITGSIVPSADLLAEVRSHLADLCPNDVKYLRVLAPIFVPVNLTIALTPDTAAVRTEVEEEVAAFIVRERRADGYTMELSRLREAISSAPNERSHNLVLPAADVVFATYELPTPGVITWQ